MKYIKYFIVSFTIILSFSLNVFSKDNVLENAVIKEINGDAFTGNFTFENDELSPSIIFKNVGDAVIYQLYLNYDSSLYEIDNVNDNNQNHFIKTSYSVVDDKLFMMLKYDREVESDFSLNSIKVQVKLKEKSVNPKTNQNMIWIVLLLYITLIFFLVLSSKMKKKLLLFILFIPFVVYAKEDNILEFNVSTSNIKIAYTIEFYKGNGVTGSLENITCIYGETCDLPLNTLVNEGNAFKGWSLEPGGEVLFLDEAQVMDLIASGKITLYPVWKKEYTIQFNGNGSTSGSMSNLVCVEGDTCVLSANQFQKTDYIFSGWATSSSGNVVYSDQEDITIESSLSLYAKWLLAVTNFDYTGSAQNFTVSTSGRYKLEVWGAQGAAYENSKIGYGGYSYGTISLTSGTTLYVYVGGAGSLSSSSSSGGGYNGGGNTGSYSTYKGGGGGGATHISLTACGILSYCSNSVSNILIVAGGGGGSSYTSTVSGYGGSGGGYIGVQGGSATSSSGNGYGGYGGTQSSGGGAGTSTGGTGFGGTFGTGGNGDSFTTSAGGGGFYGGGAGSRYNPVAAGGGGGGSGYIGNSSLTNKAMYCYQCQTSSDSSTLTYSTTNTSSTATSNYAKAGNGYARITYLGS